MFGLSFAELIVIILAALIFIKPKDLPEVARFLGRSYYRCKKLWSDVKIYLKSVENELGLSELRQELNKGISDEKSKIEDEITTIVDMYGNEHQVSSVKKIRSDLTDEEIDAEVEKLNEENLLNAKESPKLLEKDSKEKPPKKSSSI